jgi:SH3 domain protein
MTAEKLEKEKKELQARTTRSEAIDRELREENAALKRQLESERKELSTLRQEHDALKKGAAQYLQLKSAHDQLTSEFQQYRSKFDEVEKKYTILSSSTAVEWFLTGAGVLFGGWLLGLLMARSRRRGSRNSIDDQGRGGTVSSTRSPHYARTLLRPHYGVSCIMRAGMRLLITADVRRLTRSGGA